MQFWEDVTPTQYAANTLLLPSFTLRMMAHDWSLMNCSFDYAQSEQTGGSLPGSGVAWRLVGPLVSINFPTDWGYDETYAASMALRISVRVEARYSAGTPTSIRLTEIAPGTINGPAVDTLGPTYSYFTLTLDYVAADGDALPTGVHTYYVEFEGGDGDQVKIQKTLDDEGPNSWFGFIAA